MHKFEDIKDFGNVEEALERGTMNKLKTMAQIIRKRRMFCVSPDDTAQVACRIMTNRNIGAIPVIDDNNKLVGIVSERDIVRRCVAKKRRAFNTLISEIMTEEPLFVSPDDSIVVGMALMLQNHVRHLPVVDKGEVIGTVTIREITTEVTSMAMSNLGLMAMAGQAPMMPAAPVTETEQA